MLLSQGNEKTPIEVAYYCLIGSAEKNLASFIMLQIRNALRAIPMQCTRGKRQRKCTVQPFQYALPLWISAQHRCHVRQLLDPPWSTKESKLMGNHVTHEQPKIMISLPCGGG